MIDHDERTTGVKLTLLNLSPILHAAAMAPGATATAYEVGFGPYAMAEVDGTVYVICHEGVGWRVTDDAPLELDLYAKVQGAITIFPALQARLTPAQVRELATGGEVDLANHVRRFGARLESNFWLWHRTLSTPTRTTQEV